MIHIIPINKNKQLSICEYPLQVVVQLRIRSRREWKATILSGNVPDYGVGIRNDDQKLIVVKSDRLLLGLSAVRRKTY